MQQPASLSALRRAVGALETSPPRRAGNARFALGMPGLDAWLGGGLACGVLHEVHAGHARYPTASIGFGLGMALRASGGHRLVWIRQDAAGAEAGEPYGEGLAAFGLDPERLFVVRAGDPTDALRAAAEVARCPGVGAALVEIRGAPRVLDLTASRRLALAAGVAGVTLVMIRLGADLGARPASLPAPSAAVSRWRVEAAASKPLEAGAPGRPAFVAALLRHRSGLGPRRWRLEWNRDSASFAEPTLPRPALPVPVRGSVAAEDAARNAERNAERNAAGSAA